MDTDTPIIAVFKCEGGNIYKLQADTFTLGTDDSVWNFVRASSNIYFEQQSNYYPLNPTDPNHLPLDGSYHLTCDEAKSTYVGFNGQGHANLGHQFQDILAQNLSCFTKTGMKMHVVFGGGY